VDHEIVHAAPLSGTQRYLPGCEHGGDRLDPAACPRAPTPPPIGQNGCIDDTTMTHITTAELEEGLENIRRSPRARGRLELIVRRPAVDVREILDEAVLDLTEGLVGDTWRARGSSRSADGSANPREQITLMNSRAAALVSRGGAEAWALAGNQLFIDLDLSEENLPAGSRLAIGTVVLEISEEPHTGCKKFSARFGMDATRYVNSPIGRAHRVRGANAFVVQPGTVRTGAAVEVQR
jgi:hypothetical protein